MKTSMCPPDEGGGGGLAMTPNFLILRSANSYNHNLQHLYENLLLHIQCDHDYRVKFCMIE